MITNLEEKEQFYTDIISSSDVLRITIPKHTVEGAGLKVGDKVKVWITKIEKGE